MIEAQADIALGEAIRPAALAHSKVSGGGTRGIILAALGFAIVMVSSSLLAMVLPLISLRLQGFENLLFTAAGLIGILLAFRILARQQLRSFLGGLRRLGSPEVFPTHFRFDEHGFEIDSNRHSYRAPWTSVLFVIPAPEHWLMQVDTTTFAVPKRAFGKGGERSFLELAEQSLPPAARDRSVFANQ